MVAEAGCPWGQAGPLPLAIRLLVWVLESIFEASFFPFYLQGEIYPPQAVAAGSRQMVAPQGTLQGSCSLIYA